MNIITYLLINLRHVLNNLNSVFTQKKKIGFFDNPFLGGNFEFFFFFKKKISVLM
jgi:hypothetical protein